MSEEAYTGSAAISKVRLTSLPAQAKASPRGSTLCAWSAFITKGGGGQMFIGCAQLPHLFSVYLEGSGRPAFAARFGSCQVFSGCAQLATQGFHALSQRAQLQLHHLHALRPHLGRPALPAALSGAPAQQDAHLLAPKQSVPCPAPLLSTRKFSSLGREVMVCSRPRRYLMQL